ncbi:MAG: VOC family protein [Alphaproteobacteria bacterium]
MTYSVKIEGLHHNAYRIRDSEETRKFYEDFLGLRLSSALDVEQSYTRRKVQFLHTFYEMNDGSFLAFFEVPKGQEEFDFSDKSDFDLHIAVEVTDRAALEEYMEKARQAGIPFRGPSDHKLMHSIYFRDPNGYVIELTAKDENYDELMAQEIRTAHDVLKNWQARKARGQLAAE